MRENEKHRVCEKQTVKDMQRHRDTFNTLMVYCCRRLSITMELSQLIQNRFVLRDRQTDTERDRDRQTERRTERQTDRETQTDRQTDGQRDEGRQTDRPTVGQRQIENTDDLFFIARG